MAITNTHTEEFDWTSMGQTRTDNGTQVLDFLNDSGHKDYTDDGGSGRDSYAYNNWRSLGRTHAPGYDMAFPAMVGSATKDDATGETYLSSVKNGNFQSDGMFQLGTVSPAGGDIGYQAHISPWSSADQRCGIVYDEGYSQATSTVTTYHSKDAAGLAPGKFIPIMQWNVGNNAPNAGLDGLTYDGDASIRNFSQLPSFDDWYDSTQPLLETASTTNDAKQRMFGTHMNHPYLCTTDVSNSIRQQEHPSVALRNTHNMNDILYVGTSTSRSDTTRARADRGGLITLWYAHDGAGNGMMITTRSIHFNNASVAMHHHTTHGSYNQHFAATNPDGITSHYTKYLTQGGDQSGMSITNFPSIFESLSNWGDASCLETIASHSRDARCRVLRDPIDPTMNLLFDETSDGSYATALRGHTSLNSASHTQIYLDWVNNTSYSRVCPIPTIVMFPTPMGSIDAAALKTPQNLYLHMNRTNNGPNSNHNGVNGYFTPNVSIKFGNMTRQNIFPFLGAGEVPTELGTFADPVNNTYSEASHEYLAVTAQTNTPFVIASHEGNIGINRVTWGAQDPAPHSRREVRYYEFPGIAATYNAASATTYSINAGNMINLNDSWENPEALMDGSDQTGTTCTSTGIENALCVKLGGLNEGAVPDDAEPVKQLVLNTGGIRKLILGPQVIKIGIYSNDAESLGNLIAGPATLKSDSSDQISPIQQSVFDTNTFIGSPTYGDIKDAWVAIYAESPQ